MEEMINRKTLRLAVFLSYFLLSKLVFSSSLLHVNKYFIAEFNCVLKKDSIIVKVNYLFRSGSAQPVIK